MANVITPQITNTTVPMVVFVGPAASGKTMILVRLAKYLRDHGYTVDPDQTFLNTKEYLDGCKRFQNSLNTNIALDGTVEFLLVSVRDNSGCEIAKLLEAPGEDFFSTNNPEDNNHIKDYLSTIMSHQNPKSFVVLLDLDSPISFRNDNGLRDGYQTRIINTFYKNLNKATDKTILLYNKIDKTPYGNLHGCQNPKTAREDAEKHYPQFFSTMKRNFLVFFKIDDFAFLPFCTGIYTDKTDEFGEKIQTYDPANDCYPEMLWKEITKKF